MIRHIVVRVSVYSEKELEVSGSSVAFLREKRSHFPEARGKVLAADGLRCPFSAGSEQRATYRLSTARCGSSSVPLSQAERKMGPE